MSSKGTIFLTADNEHWYHDCNDDSITIEIKRENVQWDGSDESEFIIEIKPNCDLWENIMKR